MQPLELRDIHQSVAPGWWPPAPGWWVVAATLVALLLALVWWARRRIKYRKQVEALFDEALAAAADAPSKVLVISGLLRRAARRHRGDADTLEGTAWLEVLNHGLANTPFQGETARLLLEGGYRPEVDPQQLEALQQAARQRFLLWMGVRR